MASNKDRFYADIMALHPEVTGSCNFVVVKYPDSEKETRFCVDFGLFQERDHEELNTVLPFDPDKLDFVLVTHNHIDHIGRLPFLVSKGFQKPIYTTATTSKLMPLALNDSYSVLKDVAKRKNRRPLYSEDDVRQTMNNVVPCGYNKPIKPSENVTVTFFKNGHLVGAAVILVQISCPGHDDINIVFTGDYNSENMFFDVDKLPERVRDLPVTVVTESTYGDMDSTEIRPCFKENILRCIEKEGIVIAPVFSLGRSQEILYVLKCMQDEGELSEQIPIYLDGKLAIRYTNLYLSGGLDIRDDMRNFLPQNYTFVDKTMRAQVATGDESKIILTTSGMGTYGPAQFYLPEFIGRPKALVHFTGYTAEGTLGNRLKVAETGDPVEIGGIITKKYARIEYTSEFSAHAKANQLIDFLKQFRNLKLILINHGEAEVKETFALRVLDEVDTKNVGILGRKYFFRINPYGLVKTLSTKFE